VTDKPPLDLEAEYNNRAAVPDHPAVLARWKAEAEAARAAHPPLALPYGPGEREVIDLFEAAPDAPIVVFLHGGYWQALDRSWFSWIAPAFLSHGVSLAIPSYDLAPSVRLGRIIGQVRVATDLVRARNGGWRPVVFGHSAGGHMAACMLSEALQLDPREAAALSPIHWPVPNGSTPGGTVLDCLVGGDETSEFIRQSRHMADLWGGLGVETRFEALPGLNHFTVLDPLGDPGSALMQRIVELARAF
jgi:arylformamidase